MMTLRRVPTSVRRLIEQVLERVLVGGRGKTHPRDDALARGRPVAEADIDPARMRQAFANLLDNALKYTSEGGEVAVHCERDEAGRVRVVVRDNGMGITREEQGRIWERLYRGDRSRGQRGLGLGLSLVKAVVEAHGGSVKVESEPGAGATFAVTLPDTAGPALPMK